MKALWYLRDTDPWGHSVQRLLAEFPHRDEFQNLDDLLQQSALLDQFYIPTCYPNGLPDLTPGQVYRPPDAGRGLVAARTLLAACAQWLDEH